MVPSTPYRHTQDPDANPKRLVKDEREPRNPLQASDTAKDHLKLPEDIEKPERKRKVKRNKIRHPDNERKENNWGPTDRIPRFRRKQWTQIVELAAESRKVWK